MTGNNIHEEGPEDRCDRVCVVRNNFSGPGIYLDGGEIRRVIRLSPTEARDLAAELVEAAQDQEERLALK